MIKKSVKGYKRPCKFCPYYTANAGGTCTTCLNLGITHRQPTAREEMVRGRELSRRADAILRPRKSDSLPAAVMRGMGVCRDRLAA